MVVWWKMITNWGGVLLMVLGGVFIMGIIVYFIKKEKIINFKVNTKDL